MPRILARANALTAAAGATAAVEACTRLLDDPALVDAHWAMLTEARRQRGEVNVALVVGLAKLEEAGDLAEAVQWPSAQEKAAVLSDRRGIERLIDLKRHGREGLAPRVVGPRCPYLKGSDCRMGKFYQHVESSLSPAPERGGVRRTCERVERVRRCCIWRCRLQCSRGPDRWRNGVDVRRLRQVFQPLLAEINHLRRDLSSHTVPSVRGDADSARCGEALKSRGHIHPIAVDIVRLHDDVAKIDADAKFDATVLRHSGVACGHHPLNLDCTPNRVDDADELNECAVASVLDDSSAMTPDRRIDHLIPTGL